METITYYKRKPETGTGVFRHVGFDDNGDYLFTMLIEDVKPWSVRKVDVPKDFDEVKDYDITKLERQTCGRRMSSYSGQFKQEPNLDYWDERGGEYPQCSFCGSAKFELFLEVIDAVNEGKEGYTIEQATGKNYKYYLGTPKNRQIKFYTPHIPDELFGDGIKLKELNEKLGPACKKSFDSMMSRFNKTVPDTQ